MSFKDDFLEALRSVKRDFMREPEHTQSSSAAPPAEETIKETISEAAAEESATMQASNVAASAEETLPPPQEADGENVISVPQQPDEVVYEAFKQASTIDESEFQQPEEGFFDRIAEGKETPDDEDDIFSGDTTPYRSFDPSSLSGDLPSSFGGGAGGGRYTNDFDDTESFGGGDKTIISKNTVINGSLSTDDSLRLLGQVLGDIDCRSNIVVAGKVRGNTTAANAYVFDAQIDGDLRCDDSVNVSNDAWILGNIRAQQAEIDGKIKGNIEIRHMVSIGPSSSVLGDISADELEIKRGAFVNGQVMMYSPSRDVLDRFDNFED